MLRTINAARSAYMSVTFDARFFDEYHVFDCTVVQAGILMKASAAQRAGQGMLCYGPGGGAAASERQQGSCLAPWRLQSSQRRVVGPRRQ